MRAREAKTVPIVPLMERLGHRVTRVHGHQVFFKSPFRDERTASFNVNTARNIWFDFGIGQGGTVIDLVVKLNNCSVAQALDYLASHRHRSPAPPASPRRTAPEQSAHALLQLRRADTVQHPALLKYLRERCIPEMLGRAYLQEIHYQNVKYPDTGFFALGLPNQSGGYELRNAYFQGSLGRKDLSFIAGDDQSSVAVFEGAFDFLSHLAHQEYAAPPCDVVVLNSVSLVERCAAWMKRRNYSRVMLFLDNDTAGERAASHFAQHRHHITRQNGVYAGFKDYNAFWIAKSRDLQVH